MKCAWKEFLEIIPRWMVREIDTMGRDKLLELRLRMNAPPELVTMDGVFRLTRTISREDLEYCVNSASRYSPWAAATIADGYLTAPGGHRIGLCGEAVYKDGVISGIKRVSSLCIRVARDFPGVSHSASFLKGSVLILGSPGWGKTTLLRDLARQIAQKETVCVVDERGELFPDQFSAGKRMDILTGASKAQGINMVLRTMGPEYIAVDEITEEADCNALLRAQGCGVKLLATAHAGSVEEFRHRGIYSPLITNRVFSTLLILHADKSFRTERMQP